MESLSPYEENGFWWTLRSPRCLYSVVLYVYISINIYRYVYRGWTERKPNLAVGDIALPWKASRPKSSRPKAVRETGFCPTLAQHLVLVCPAERMSDSLDKKTDVS